jgi:hypothetical protein
MNVREADKRAAMVAVARVLRFFEGDAFACMCTGLRRLAGVPDSQMYLVGPACSLPDRSRLWPPGRVDRRSDEPPLWFLCLRCGFLSFNLDDVKNQYCGRCRLFHQG